MVPTYFTFQFDEMISKPNVKSLTKYTSKNIGYLNILWSLWGIDEVINESYVEHHILQ